MGIKKQPRLKPKSIDAKGADTIDFVDAKQGREACLDSSWEVEPRSSRDSFTCLR